jgi:integrase
MPSIPKVPGRRAIKIATPEQYLKVRACLPTKPAQVFSTLLVSSGIRFCEAIGLQPADFDFEAGIVEVARSVVKVSWQARTPRRALRQGLSGSCGTLFVPVATALVADE